MNTTEIHQAAEGVFGGVDDEREARDARVFIGASAHRWRRPARPLALAVVRLEPVATPAR